MTMTVTMEVEREAKTQSDVNVEALGYVVIVSMAAALRFWNLAFAPLTTREAAQAVAALNGTPMPAGGSPLLYALNQVLFGLFGGSVGDAGVRLGAAALGTLLVLLPILWRKHIGVYGALLASASIAISPSFVLASRTLDGAIVVATSSVAIIGFALHYFNEQRKIDLIGLGIAIGVGLTSGPGMITLAVVIAPALIVGYRWIASDEDRARVKQATQAWRTVLAWSAGTWLVVATAALLRPAAMSSVPEVLTGWLKAWTEDAGISQAQLIQALMMYEPLIVAGGLLGFGYSLRRPSGVAALLDFWFCGALLLVLLQAGRQTLDVTLALTPLALLGGLFGEALFQALRRHGAWQAEGLLVVIAAAIVAYLAIVGAGYAVGSTIIGTAQFLGLQFDAGGSYAILVAIAVLIFGGIFAVLIGVRAMLRGAAVAMLIVFGLISLSNAWGVTQLRASSPFELLWGPTTTAPDVREAVKAAESASQRATGFPHQASVGVVLPQEEPVVAWYLRRFPDVVYSASPNVSTTVMITTLGVQPTVPNTPYVGARFPLRTTWDYRTLLAENWLRWWLYREVQQPDSKSETIVVWVKPQ